MKSTPKKVDDMSSDEIISEIIDKIGRIFGVNGFGGTTEEYAWLLNKYGVTEEEDNSWIDIIDFEGADGLNPQDEDEARVVGFLLDPTAVRGFLVSLLRKYRSCSAVYHK
jgi:hypothetical protein